jgi:DNA polymerase-2
VRDYVARTLRGELRRAAGLPQAPAPPLDEYERNVPPHVRAARIADEFHIRQGRPAQYRNGGWIRYLMTTAGPEPMDVREAGTARRSTTSTI